MRDKFIDIVRREVKGDAPFGLFISGGYINFIYNLELIHLL
jgi:hypothetical protein